MKKRTAPIARVPFSVFPDSGQGGLFLKKIGCSHDLGLFLIEHFIVKGYWGSSHDAITAQESREASSCRQEDPNRN